MNRDIKFRYWNEEFMDYSPQSGLPHLASINNWFHKFNGDIDEKIMQYIGVDDINGDEIYEGDIIKSNLNVGVVEYNRDIASYILRRTNKTFIRLDVIKEVMEVIGNIYENPELLNKQTI